MRNQNESIFKDIAKRFVSASTSSYRYLKKKPSTPHRRNGGGIILAIVPPMGSPGRSAEENESWEERLKSRRPKNFSEWFARLPKQAEKFSERLYEEGSNLKELGALLMRLALIIAASVASIVEQLSDPKPSGAF